jgi:hypothetical protein
MVVLLNRGLRTWNLTDAVEWEGKLVRRTRQADGTWNPADKVTKRSLPPGGSIEAIDQAEADHLLGYKEIVDAEKAVPALADREKVLRDQIASLQETINGLQARLDTYESKNDDDKKKKK